jgi:hypothetical protein
MMRKLIAVAAVSGSLAFGAAGVIGLSDTAGATVSTPTSGTPATHAARCAKAEILATRIHTRETKAATWLPKAQAREAKATAAGHTKVAARISDRITRVEKLEAKGNTVLAKIAAKCGSATSTS